MTTESTESPEIDAPSPVIVANGLLAYLHEINASYTWRHHRSDNQNEQFMIEFHASQIEHAIELMEEVRDMIAAESLWDRHHANWAALKEKHDVP